jgi:putative colanic acid biosynthesis acetyltransferase WcaF
MERCFLPRPMNTDLDIARNRAAPSWSKAELAGRMLWTLAKPLFRLSPRLIWGWRRTLLRVFGAKVGADAHIHPSVCIAMPWNLDIGPYVAIGDRVNLYALGSITIGAKATISQGAHLCAGTHDYRRPHLPLVKAPIVIGESAWVCADAFVGPGVTIGELAIVGARAVAMKDVAPRKIVIGNPAHVVDERRVMDNCSDRDRLDAEGP